MRSTPEWAARTIALASSPRLALRSALAGRHGVTRRLDLRKRDAARAVEL
jgi:hypothetical protein